MPVGADLQWRRDGLGVLRAFLRDGDMVIPIAVPSASRTSVCGINRAGQILGPPWDATGLVHGFLKNGGLFTILEDEAVDEIQGMRALAISFGCVSSGGLSSEDLQRFWKSWPPADKGSTTPGSANPFDLRMHE